MNAERVNAVADAIERHSIPDLGFNMIALVESGYEDMSGHNCGTAACIAGWTVCLQDGFDGRARQSGILDPARRYLELTEHEAGRLFCPMGFDPDTEFGLKTPAQAVAVLRHLAATGEVDWSKAA